MPKSARKPANSAKFLMMQKMTLVTVKDPVVSCLLIVLIFKNKNSQEFLQIEYFLPPTISSFPLKIFA